MMLTAMYTFVNSGVGKSVSARVINNYKPHNSVYIYEHVVVGEHPSTGRERIYIQPPFNKGMTRVSLGPPKGQLLYVSPHTWRRDWQYPLHNRYVIMKTEQLKIAASISSNINEFEQLITAAQDTLYGHIVKYK